MRLLACLLLLVMSRSLLAANEEQFEWGGVNFCHTTVGEVIELYPNARYFEDFEFLAVSSKGETLGAKYEELFFLTRPDGVITGVFVLVVSGDFGDIEKLMDGLAAERWNDRVLKNDHADTITWLRSDQSIGDTSDVHMHLQIDQTSPLYNIGLEKTEKKYTVISFSSNYACGRAIPK